eukprot:7687973-Alexandrium_andersonii.AAC.1
MGRNTHRVTEPPSQRYYAPNPPWEVAVPARPTGQTALSAARNLHTSEPPILQIRCPLLKSGAP